MVDIYENNLKHNWDSMFVLRIGKWKTDKSQKKELVQCEKVIIFNGD